MVATGGGIVAVLIVVWLIQMQTLMIPSQTDTSNQMESNQDVSKIKVVASFYPLYEFAKNVGGDKAEVLVFIPTGVEPHDWEPSTGDILRLKTANVFVYNGAGMEPFVEKLISSEEYANVKFVETSDGVDLIESEDEHENEIERDVESIFNPHIWLDPILAKHQVSLIKDAMVETDPQNKQYYENNANTYITKLEGLDSKIKSELSNCNKDTFVPFHDAYTYFANRYGLNVFPLSGVSPESEATAAELKEFIDFVKENKIKVIYSEELVDPKLSQTLADEAGAQVLTFSPIEGLTNSELESGMTYLQKMEQNLENLKVGLECQ